MNPANTTMLAEVTAWLTIGVGVVLLILALVIAGRIVTGSIDVTNLLNDGVTGEASTSRFQLLVFTFVIGFSYVIFLVNVMATAGTKEMPQIPWSLLALLGVSAVTYATGKKLDETAPASPESKPKDEAKK